MRPSHLVIVAALLGNVLLAGCTKQNPLYCSETRPCQTLSAPICDATTNACRPCERNADCEALDLGKPVCTPTTGVCVGCNADTDCTAANAPICDLELHRCEGCSKDLECMTRNSKTPICLGLRSCVECGKDTDCTNPGKPICDANDHICRPCGGNTECTALSSTTPVCGPTGACLGCAVNSDCKTPAAVVCDAKTTSCRGCESSSECATVDPTKPVCLATGLCVECNADRDCKGATKPICDVAAHTCRGCQDDAECPADPGVCMAHIDGHCAVAAETIYVQEEGSVTCSDTPPGPPAVAATKDAPVCSLQVGLGLVSASRPLVVVRGTVYSGNAAVVATTEPFVYSIVGKQSAAATSLNSALTLKSGTVYIRDLKLGSPYSTALTATGGTLKLDHVMIDGAGKGGILLDGAAFDIRYTLVSNSGPGTVEADQIGGIFVRTLSASGPKVLTNVTLQGNMPYDLSCVGPIMAMGVLTSTGVDGRCGITTCAAPSPTCGALALKTSQSP
jgi:hypothetical protein